MARILKAPSGRLLSFIALMTVGAAAGRAEAPGEPDRQADCTLVPWDKLAADQAELVRQVVSQPSFYHRTSSEVFACDPQLYLTLLYEPVLTLELWKSLGLTRASIRKMGPNEYEGDDGAGSTGRCRYLYKSPELNVLYIEAEYRGKILPGRIKSRSVIVSRSVFFREHDGNTYVKHQTDGYVRLENPGVLVLAHTLRPVFERAVKSSLAESQWFVSLMCRYAVYNPRAVQDSIEASQEIDPELKEKMARILAPLISAKPAIPEEAKLLQAEAKMFPERNSLAE